MKTREYSSSLTGAVLAFLTLVLWTGADVSGQSITGNPVDCVSGEAAGFPCKGVRLLSFLSAADLETHFLNDVWVWADFASGREFALVGTWDHLAFVEVTDPINPVYLGKLPAHNNVPGTNWRDMKVYKDHVYVTADLTDHGMQVFDLTALLSHTGSPVDFEETAHYSKFRPAHNIAINEETGYVYAGGTSGSNPDNPCARALHMVDIRNPTDPTYAGCFRDDMTGRASDGYVHDLQCLVYRGPDQDYTGREICITFNENAISIVDVTDKSAPSKITHATYPDVAYTHQGWLTEDYRFLFMNDEQDEEALLDLAIGRGTGWRTLIWDVEDLDDPVVYREYWGAAKTRDHNLYIKGSLVYMANYTSGFRVLDIANLTTSGPVEVAYLDTYPAEDNLAYDAAWTANPFLPSGIVVVSSEGEGLFVVEVTASGVTGVEPSAPGVPASFTLSTAYPNPFNPSTSVELTTEVSEHFDIRAYDIAGREVAVLHSGTLSAGRHHIRFEARDLESGVYLIRASSASGAQVQAATLVK